MTFYPEIDRTPYVNPFKIETTSKSVYKKNPLKYHLKISWRPPSGYPTFLVSTCRILINNQIRPCTLGFIPSDPFRYN